MSDSADRSDRHATDTSRGAPSGTRPGGVIRCGVVGVGRMGRHHARVYSQLAKTDPKLEFVGVVDADADRAAGIAEQFGGRAFSTEAELLRAGVDAVSIAVPTTAHKKSAQPMLEAGVACLIEKPLAQDGATAMELKELAERTGSVLMVGHIERFNPVVRAMQLATVSGDPIVPRFIEVHRVSPMTFRSIDIGVVMDMMIHDLDVVLMLMGGQEPDEIHASGVAVVTEHEDVCNARLTFHRPEGSCVANITASRLALKTERVTRITGENAYVKIDYGAKKGTMIRRLANQAQMSEVHAQLRDGQDLTTLNWADLVNIEPLEIDNADQLEMEIDSFVDCIRSGRRPQIDAEAGFVNVRTAERIVQAIRDFSKSGNRSPEIELSRPRVPAADA